jgi:hypothetical protein
MADPEPRAAAACREIQAATSEMEKAMTGYRAGTVSAQGVNRAEKRLRDANWRAITVSNGRIDEFSNE